MHEQHTPPPYVRIWYWLLGLALASVGVSALPLPPPVAVGLIFIAAAVKAWLVVVYYMHLKFERWPVYTLIAVPLLLCGVLVLVLIPELVHYQQ